MRVEERERRRRVVLEPLGPLARTPRSPRHLPEPSRCSEYALGPTPMLCRSRRANACENRQLRADCVSRSLSSLSNGSLDKGSSADAPDEALEAQRMM